MRTYNCAFCGKEITPGTGLTFVRNDGTVLHFCSSKCKRNALKLHRSPKKVKWVIKAGKSDSAKAARVVSSDGPGQGGSGPDVRRTDHVCYG